MIAPEESSQHYKLDYSHKKHILAYHQWRIKRPQEQEDCW